LGARRGHAGPVQRLGDRTWPLTGGEARVDRPHHGSLHLVDVQHDLTSRNAHVVVAEHLSSGDEPRPRLLVHRVLRVLPLLFLKLLREAGLEKRQHLALERLQVDALARRVVVDLDAEVRERVERFHGLLRVPTEAVKVEEHDHVERSGLRIAQHALEPGPAEEQRAGDAVVLVDVHLVERPALSGDELARPGLLPLDGPRRTCHVVLFR
jgi:hypothetical protein